MSFGPNRNTVSSKVVMLNILLLVAALGVVTLMVLPAPGSKQHAVRFKEAQQIAARLERRLKAFENSTNTFAYAKLLPVSPFRKDIAIVVTSFISTHEERERLCRNIAQFSHEAPGVIFRGDLLKWQPEPPSQSAFSVWLNTVGTAVTDGIGMVSTANVREVKLR